MLIGSVFRTGKTYYPQVILQGCKYINLMMILIEKILIILMKKNLMKKRTLSKRFRILHQSVYKC